MPTLDAASIAALRATLSGVRGRPDEQRLTAVITVLDGLLAALAESAAAPQPLTVDSLGCLTLRAAQKITLTTGLASLTMTVQGDILLKGKDVSAKTTGDVALAGNKVRDGATPTLRGFKVGSN